MKAKILSCLLITSVAVCGFLFSTAWGESFNFSGVSNNAIIENSGSTEGNWTLVAAAGTLQVMSADADDTKSPEAQAYTETGEALLQQLDTLTGFDRAYCMDALAEMGYKEAAPVFLGIVQDKGQENISRMSAMEDLGTLKYTQASGVLLSVLQDKIENMYVRSSAAKGLAAMGAKDFQKYFSAIMRDKNADESDREDAIDILKDSGYADLGKDLQSVLKDPQEKPTFIKVTLYTLGELKYSPAASDVLFMLSKDNPNRLGEESIHTAVDALVAMNCYEAGPLLMAKAFDKTANSSDRMSSLEALGKIGYIPAGEELLKLAQDEEQDDYNFREIAIKALGNLKYAPAGPYLLSLVEKGDWPWYEVELAETAITALGDMGYTEAGNVLIRIMKDNFSTYREYMSNAAMGSLAKMNYTDAIPELHKLVSYAPAHANGDAGDYWIPAGRVAAIEALSAMGYRDMCPDLVRILQDKQNPQNTDSYVMGAAVTALSAMDYTEAAEVFRALINEYKGGAICTVAVEALGKWGYKEAYGDLVAIVKDPSIQRETRLAAARVLGQWKR